MISYSIYLISLLNRLARHFISIQGPSIIISIIILGRQDARTKTPELRRQENRTPGYQDTRTLGYQEVKKPGNLPAKAPYH